jgi:hypothetical protein
MKIGVFWDETSCNLIDVTDVSEQHAASTFRVEDGSSTFLKVISKIYESSP